MQCKHLKRWYCITSEKNKRLQKLCKNVEILPEEKQNRAVALFSNTSEIKKLRRDDIGCSCNCISLDKTNSCNFFCKQLLEFHTGEKCTCLVRMSSMESYSINIFFLSYQYGLCHFVFAPNTQSNLIFFVNALKHICSGPSFYTNPNYIVCCSNRPRFL